MEMPHAVLGGCALIALAVGYHSLHEPPRHFQVTQFQPGLVARMDTRTGSIELCGRVQLAGDLIAPTDEMTKEAMRKTGVTEKQIEDMNNIQVNLATSSHCFALATPWAE